MRERKKKFDLEIKKKKKKEQMNEREIKRKNNKRNSHAAKRFFFVTFFKEVSLNSHTLFFILYRYRRQLYHKVNEFGGCWIMSWPGRIFSQRVVILLVCGTNCF